MDIFFNLESSPLLVKKPPPSKKYISIFKIDGIPILGPLMTEEKSREMQSYREKAIKLERILSEKRLRKLQNNENHSLTEKQTPRSQLESSNCTQITIENDCSTLQTIVPLKENDDDDDDDDDECDILIQSEKVECNLGDGGDNEINVLGEESHSDKSTNTIESELMSQHNKDFADFGTNTYSVTDDSDDVNNCLDLTENKRSDIVGGELRLFERIKKLEKSDTIIYDNRHSSVIMASDEMELEEEVRKLKAQHQMSEEQRKIMQQNLHSNLVQELVAKFSFNSPPKQQHSPGELRGELERQIMKCKSNNSINSNRESLHLPLASQNAKLHFSGIPSICVNPPTPLVGPSSVCDTNFSESESGADSFQYSQATTAMTTTTTHPPEDDSSEDEPSFSSVLSRSEKSRSIAQVSGSPEKQLRFEQLPSESESKFRCQVYRSVTSPSLQLLSKKPTTKTMMNNSYPGKASNDEASNNNGLVRSNSFTLETPSKALIDHMRQKKPNSHCGNSNKRPSRRFGESPSPSAMRDTVESKAKRVQKAELKPRATSCVTTKRIQKKSANNPFNTIPHRPSAAPVWGSGNNAAFDKSKITSPYGSSSSKTSPNVSRCLVTRRTPTALKQRVAKKQPVKKVTSTTTYTLDQSQTPSSSIRSWDTSSPSNASASPAVAPTSPQHVPNETLQEIENRHRQKYMQLLAYQQEEQQRLQRTFEAQHKLLMDQLSSEMNRVGVVQSSTPTSTASTLKSHPLAIQQHQSQKYFSDSAVPPTTTSFCLMNANISPKITETITTTALGQTITTTKTTMMDCNVIPDLNMDLNYCLTSDSTSSQPQTAFHDNGNLLYQRRRLLSCEDVGVLRHRELSNNILNNNNNNINNNVSPRRIHGHGEHKLDEAERRTAAAITLQAAIRGFLVRRLFRTEQIQRIVQTIRDTLIFVLNLHMDTLDDPEEANSPANIKLKARLLQQICSATRTLHLILFQTSVKERMEIIERDRKRIRTKLAIDNIRK